MKHSKILWWLAALAGLLLALFFALLIFPRSPGAGGALTNLGKVAPVPRGFSISSPATWQTPLGTPRDWVDRGQDAMADWDHNPFVSTHFCEHLVELRQSGDSADQLECKRLENLAKQWRENLLRRYPNLKGAPNTLPDHENGIRHLLDLANKSGTSGFELPYNLKLQVSDKKAWDSAAARAWLAPRKKTLEEIRSISGMPANMNAELAKEWFGMSEMSAFLRNCGEALCLEARLAAEQGDFAQALDSVKASGDLARFLSKTRNPLLTCVHSGFALLERSRNLPFQSILPQIPSDQLDLSAWEAALQPTLQTPAEFSECMKTEWTGFMLAYMLPALADPAESNKPHDLEFLVEAYTRYYSDIVRDHAALTLGDLPSHPWKTMSGTGLSWRSQQLCQWICSYNFRFSWERTQVRIGLTQAAFAILKGASPPADPIYGQPYHWNPQTRELSQPDGLEFKDYHLKPIKLPKL